MNYTVYCRLAWPKKCIISVKCVTSTTLGDTQRMLGLLRGAPGVVSYFRRKTARCVSRNGPKSDRCHLGDESPNLSGIGLRCVSCNRPQVPSGVYCIFTCSLETIFVTVNKYYKLVSVSLSAAKTALHMFSCDRSASLREKDIFRSLKVSISPSFSLCQG